MGAMAKNDVANLVRYNSRDLGFVIRRFDRSSIYIDKPAGQCEGVDGSIVYDFELKGILCIIRRVCSQILPERVDISRGIPIINDLQLPFGLPGGLAPHLNVLLR